MPAREEMYLDLSFFLPAVMSLRSAIRCGPTTARSLSQHFGNVHKFLFTKEVRLERYS